MVAVDQAGLPRGVEEIFPYRHGAKKKSACGA